MQSTYSKFWLVAAEINISFILNLITSLKLTSLFPLALHLRAGLPTSSIITISSRAYGSVGRAFA